eukprot:503234-Hanusia_phi.AAC.1
MGATDSPIVGTPSKTGATPRKFTPLRNRTPNTPSRDSLVKVTFSVKHEMQVEDASMFVIGSLPSLGSWDPRRARKMSHTEDGTWIIAIYLPEKVEFLYQYCLIKEEEDTARQPLIVWQGNIERKCKVDNASDTPGKQLVLEDDTAADNGCEAACQELKIDPLVPVGSNSMQQKLEVKQMEIDQLLEERERCQNELQKLKDIIGYADNPDDYKKRQSYLPDCSSLLYDTVREVRSSLLSPLSSLTLVQLQSSVQSKLRKTCASISEDQAFEGGAHEDVK